MPQTHAHPQSPAKPLRDDDDLDPLPPLDGGSGEDPDEPAEDFEDNELPAHTAHPFEDALVAEDIPPELVVVGDEAGWLDYADESTTLDVGAADLDFDIDEKDLLRGHDELGVGDEDFGFTDEPRANLQDAGEEGPEDEDEALREGDLPRLDADEEGEGEDASFYDPLIAVAGEAVSPVRYEHPWEKVVAPQGMGAVHSIACGARGILVACGAVVRVDLEGASETLAAKGLPGGDVLQVQCDAALVVATTEESGVFVSKDAGATFQAVHAWKERVGAQEAASGFVVALGRGVLWGRTSAGKLLVSRDGGETWDHAGVDGFALAIDVDERGAIVALVGAMGRAEIVRGSLRDSVAEMAEGSVAAGTLETTRVPPSQVTVQAGAEAGVVARGAATAFAVHGEGVHRTLDGTSWSRIEGTTGREALAFIDNAGTLLVALASETEDRVFLARVDAEGVRRVVAEVESFGSEAVVLAWDEAHGLAWLGGAFGVIGFQPRARAIA